MVNVAEVIRYAIGNTKSIPRYFPSHTTKAPSLGLLCYLIELSPDYARIVSLRGVSSTAV